MPEKIKNTAILVFVRDPKHEAEEKVFANHIGFFGNHKIAKKLNERIISQSQSSGISTFVIDSSQQFGATFGERFANAFEAVFSKGFEKVIAVGNDCLSLNCKSLWTAAKDLEKNDLVVGPTIDGGFYLIGISKRIFQPESFKKFRWTTSFLKNDFQAFILNNKITSSFLETFRDVDDESTLKLALQELPKLYFFRRAIEKILAIYNFLLLTFNNHFESQISICFLPLRAPPRANKNLQSYS